jgi:hypothetical protein
MALAPDCVGRVVKVDNACGCTLTRANITGLTPEEFEALSYKEIALSKAILDAKEAKMLGVVENPLMTLLNGTTTDIKVGTEQIDGEQSIILPFYQRTQRSVINANYFTVIAGNGTPTAGTGSVPISAWTLTLGLGNSPFQTTLEDIERYFVPGSTLNVKTWDNVNSKNARTLTFTIVSATNADVGATPRASVIVYPPVSAANWVTYSAAEKSVWQPLFGMADLGANSIADPESYCQTQPSDLSKKIVLSWLQTTRESYCRESTYEKVLGYILNNQVNDYLKAFRYQSIAEQQRQQKIAYDKAWYNSVFYGMAIDVDNQTSANYRNLPAVYDVANPECVLSYKARAIGIFNLLDACNRVRDFVGLPLDLNMLFSDLYYLRRNREATSERARVIDGFTDRITADTFFESMTKFYSAKYGWETTRYAKMGEEVTHDGMLMFTYDRYDIKEAGVVLALFQLDYFNDLIDAYNFVVVGWDFSTRANNLWFIDWSDIKIGVAKTKQVTRRSPNPNTDLADYQCVIDPVVKTYDLRSKMWTVLLDRPDRHLIYHNFSAGCPTVTIPGCTVPQS